MPASRFRLMNLDCVDVRKLSARMRTSGKGPNPTIWVDLYLDDDEDPTITLFMSDAPDEAARIADALGEPAWYIERKRFERKPKAATALNLIPFPSFVESPSDTQD